MTQIKARFAAFFSLRSLLTLAFFGAMLASRADVKFVDYIKGDGTAYIDLGYKLDNACRVEVELMTGDAITSMIYGARTSSSTSDSIICGMDTSANNYLLTDFQKGDAPGRLTLNSLSDYADKRLLIVNQASGAVASNLTDGVQLVARTTKYDGYFQTPQNSYLFFASGTVWSSNKFSGRIYAFRVYRSGVLASDFRPCVKDDVAGMIDVVTGTFFGPANGGAFTAGADATPADVRFTAEGAVEYLTTVTAPEGGKFTVNGTAYTSSAQVWLAKEATVKVVAEVATAERAVWAGAPRGAFESLAALEWKVGAAASVSYAIGSRQEGDGYRFLDYIQGTGTGGTAGGWFETDYVPHPQTDKIVAVFSYPNPDNNTHAIFVARRVSFNASDLSYSVFQQLSNSQRRFGLCYNNTSEINSFQLSQDVKYTLTCSNNVFTLQDPNGILKINKTFTLASSFTEAGGAMLLFASENLGQPGNKTNFSNHRLYSFEVYRDGVLIHKLVPCLKDGVATLCDIVATDKMAIVKKGNFTAGNVRDDIRVTDDGACELALSVKAGATSSYAVNGVACSGTTNIWFKPNTAGATLVCDEVEGLTPLFKQFPEGVTKSDDRTLSIDVSGVPLSISLSNSMEDRPTTLKGIVSDGAQWFNTLYYPNQNTTVEMCVTNSKPVNSDRYLFGVDQSGKYFNLVQRSNNTHVRCYVGSKDSNWQEINVYSRYIHRLTPTTYYRNGEQRWQNNNAQTFQATQPLTLLAYYPAGLIFSRGIRLDYTKIWDGETLVRDYVAAEFNGELGLYDFANKTFLTSAATSGSFTSGGVRTDLRVGAAGERKWLVPVTVPAGTAYTFNGVATTGSRDFYVSVGSEVTIVVDEVAEADGPYWAELPAGFTRSADCRTATFTMPDKVWPISFSYTRPTILTGIVSNGGQWFNTGFYPNQDTTLEMCVTNARATWQTALWGAGGGGNFLAYHQANNANVYPYWGSRNGGGWKGYTFVANGRHVFKMSNKGMFCNGATLWSHSYQSDTFQCTRSLDLLCENQGSGVFPYVRLDYAKIWDGATLVRDYVAAEFNGEVGLYDFSTRFFYRSSASSGAFTAATPVLTDTRAGQTGEREWRIEINASEGLNYTVDGTAYTGPQVVWLDDAIEHTIAVTPPAGKHIVWSGVPVRVNMGEGNHKLVWTADKALTLGVEAATLTFPESLETDGSTEIFTGVRATRNLHAILDYAPLTHTSGDELVGCTLGLPYTTTTKQKEWRYCGDNGYRGPRFYTSHRNCGSWANGEAANLLSLGVRYRANVGGNTSSPYSFVSVTNALSGAQFGKWTQNYDINNGVINDFIQISQGQKLRFYSVKFFDFAVSGDATRSLTADYIPCVKDGTIGLYDRVHGGFVGNITKPEGVTAAAADRRLGADGAFEYATRISASAGARYTVNGTEYVGATNVWNALGTAMTLVVTVPEGANLVVSAKPKGATVDGNTVTWTVDGSADVSFALDQGELNAYVQTGLVAWWDALNPQGSSGLGASAWVDLKNSARYWNIGNLTYSPVTHAFEIPAGVTAGMTGTMPTHRTVDACVRWDQGRLFFRTTGQYGGLYFTPYGAIGRHPEYQTYAHVATAGVLDNYAIALGTALSQSTASFYRRGCDLGPRRMSVPIQNWGNVGNLLGGRINSETYFKGGVSAIRLYEQKLGGDELKRNAAIDRKRYLDEALPDGLKLAGGKLWVRYSFDTTAALTVLTNGVAMIDDAVPAGDYWVAADTTNEITVARTAGDAALFTGLPPTATIALADETATATFIAHWPRTVAVEIVTPDLTLTANQGADVTTDGTVLVNGTITAKNITAGRLIVGTGAAASSLTLSGALTLTGALDLNKSATLTANLCNTVGGDFTVRAGATVTHAARGTTQASTNKVDFAVAGDFVLEETGRITADQKGYTSDSSTSWLAGKERITRPMTPGRGNNDSNRNGGGVIRLAVEGAATVDGALLSRGDTETGGNYETSAGGSIWLTASSLAGHGLFNVDAGNFTHSGGNCERGGHIAVELTEDGETFDGFTGDMTASGACNKQYTQTTDKAGNPQGASGTIYLRDGTGYRKLWLKDGNLDENTSVWNWETFRNVVYPGSWYDKTEEVVVDDILCEYGSRLRVTQDGVISVRRNITGLVTNDVLGAISFIDSDQETVLTGDQTYGKFICTTAGKTIRFAGGNGSDVKIRDGGLFMVTGMVGSVVSLLAAPDAAQPWSFKLGLDVSRDVANIAVSNSTALAEVAVTAYDADDLGGNVNWNFKSSLTPIVPGEAIVWTGLNGKKWQDRDNWDRLRYVVESDDVYVYAYDDDEQPVPNNLTLVDPERALVQLVNSLTLDRKTDLTINGSTFTVTNRLSVLDAKLTVSGAEPLVANDLLIGSSGLVTLDGSTTTVGGELLVKSGATLVVTNAATLSAAKLTLEAGAAAYFYSGTVTIGDLTVADGASIAVDAATLNLTGDVTFGAADVFTAGKGFINVTGENEQTLDLAGADFNVFTVAKPAGGRVTFTVGFGANEFVCRTAYDLALAFAAGETFAFDTFVANGLLEDDEPTALLTLEPYGSGTWKLVVDGADAEGVRVSGSDASEGAQILTCAPSVDEDGNSNWIFNAKITKWQGGTGTGKNWNAAANWSLGEVPGADSIVKIDAAAAMSMTIPDGTEVGTLLVSKTGAGAVTLTMAGTLDVVDMADLGKGATLVANSKKQTTIAGNLIIRSGAKITHAQNDATEAYSVNLLVEGDLRVDAGGLIDADGCGYNVNKGPVTQAYGGCNSNHSACYGSVFAPTNCGGGGWGSSAHGGGAIYAEVKGTATVNGSIRARGQWQVEYWNNISYDAGAGGSVWLKTAKLKGYGTIDASAGFKTDGAGSSGGGRVAVELTEKTSDFSDWMGVARALYSQVPDNSSWTEAWGGSGTVWMGWTGRTGEIILGGERTERSHSTTCTKRTKLPMADDGDPAFAYRNATLVLVQHATLSLTGDMTVNDLDLREPVGNNHSTKSDNTSIYLNGFTLTVRKPWHKNGKGWYSGWSSKINYGEGGAIRWLDTKTVIRIR